MFFSSNLFPGHIGPQTHRYVPMIHIWLMFSNLVELDQFDPKLNKKVTEKISISGRFWSVFDGKKPIKYDWFFQVDQSKIEKKVTKNYRFLDDFDRELTTRPFKYDNFFFQFWIKIDPIRPNLEEKKSIIFHAFFIKSRIEIDQIWSFFLTHRNPPPTLPTALFDRESAA